mgnify:CR=1 FL=1
MGESETDDGDNIAMYNKISRMLKTLFTDKFKSDTEGYLIIKRNEDGIKGYAEIHRHYTEISGMGIRQMTTRLLNPQCAKNDDEVMKCVEIWEDQYKEALRMGMTPLEDVYKISILEDIATESIREKVEQEFYTKYNDLREHLMRIARKKNVKSYDMKTSPMEVDGGIRSATEGNLDAVGKMGPKGGSKGGWNTGGKDGGKSGYPTYNRPPGFNNNGNKGGAGGQGGGAADAAEAHRREAVRAVAAARVQTARDALVKRALEQEEGDADELERGDEQRAGGDRTKRLGHLPTRTLDHATGSGRPTKRGRSASKNWWLGLLLGAVRSMVALLSQLMFPVSAIAGGTTIWTQSIDLAGRNRIRAGGVFDRSVSGLLR